MIYDLSNHFSIQFIVSISTFSLYNSVFILEIMIPFRWMLKDVIL